MPTELRSDCRTGESTMLPFTPPPPTVPEQIDRAQLRLALTDAQIDTIKAALANLPAAKRRVAQIEWEHRAYIRRDSRLAEALGNALNLNAAQLDALFIAGDAM